jgi:hypothetical protein
MCMFCRSLFIHCLFFSFGHCVVCPSVFWPLCCLSFCLLAIVLSVLLRFTNYDYPFGFFKLFLDNRISIRKMVWSAFYLFSIFRIAVNPPTQEYGWPLITCIKYTSRCVVICLIYNLYGSWHL